AFDRLRRDRGRNGRSLVGFGAFRLGGFLCRLRLLGRLFRLRRLRLLGRLFRLGRLRLLGRLFRLRRLRLLGRLLRLCRLRLLGRLLRLGRFRLLGRLFRLGLGLGLGLGGLLLRLRAWLVPREPLYPRLGGLFGLILRDGLAPVPILLAVRAPLL